MGGKPKVFADFSGGLNNVDTIAGIADNQQTEVLNFDFTQSGTLVGRPPITFIKVPPVAGEPIDGIDYFTDSTGAVYLVCVSNAKTWLYNILLDTYTEIAPFRAADCAQYQHKLYLCSPDTSGGYWGRLSPTDPYTWNSLSTGSSPMPKGSQIVSYQDRFWLCGPHGGPDASTLFFSNVTSTSAGTTNDEYTGDYIAISPGDGQEINVLLTGTNDLFVFRDRSTWRFIYDGTPADGRLLQISSSVGADSDTSVATRENYILTLSEGTLYELVSYNFYPLNPPRQVSFQPSAAVLSPRVGSALSLIGDRAIVWIRGGVYSYNTTLKVWATWESETQLAYFFRYPNGVNVFGADTVFGTNGGSDVTKYGIYRIVDAITPGNKEEMICKVSTKAFDFDNPGAFKRMWWWGANVATGRDISAQAVPRGINSAVTTWDDMDLVTWDDLDKGSWDYPLIVVASITTDRAFPSAVPAQVFVKMNQGARFRLCSFELSFTTDGATDSGPVRVDSITVWIDAKAKVSKGVS